MMTSTLAPAVKLGALLAVLALCGMIGTDVVSVVSFDREAKFIPFLTILRRSRLLTKRIDVGTEEAFTLSRNEWKLFEVNQEPQSSCSCEVTCADPESRIDFYMTFNRRVRFNDGWEGWACKETLPFNTQTCTETPPVPGDICWVAVRGDKINRHHQSCTIQCEIDD